MLNSAAHQDPKYLEALLECRREADQNYKGSEAGSNPGVGPGQSPWKKSEFAENVVKNTLSSHKHGGRLNHGSILPNVESSGLESVENGEDDTVTLTFDPCPTMRDNDIRSAREFQSWPPNLPSNCKLQLDLLRKLSTQVRGDVSMSGKSGASNRRKHGLVNRQPVLPSPRREQTSGRDLPAVDTR